MFQLRNHECRAINLEGLGHRKERQGIVSDVRRGSCHLGGKPGVRVGGVHKRRVIHGEWHRRSIGQGFHVKRMGQPTEVMVIVIGLMLGHGKGSQ